MSAAQNGSSLSDAVRVAYVLPTLRRWLDNYERNGAHAVAQGSDARARACAASAQDIRDIIAMLDGTEDDYIAQVTRR